MFEPHYDNVANEKGLFTASENRKMVDRVIHLTTILLIISILSCGLGQMPQGAGKKFFASNEDLPFIRCSVCQKALKHVRQQTSEMRKEVASKGKKVDEDDILSIIEASCNPDKKQGDWIAKYDIVESIDGLKIVEQESPSRCKRECKTIAKACEETIGDIDTDLGEILWKDTYTLSQLINKICYEMTDACTNKLPQFKPGKRKDEIFKPMTEEEKKAFDVMKEMKSVPGMPGMEMYSKEELAQMQGQQKESPEDTQGAKEEQQSTNTEDPNLSTKLGFFDLVKETFGSFYKSIRKLFSFGSKKTEF